MALITTPTQKTYFALDGFNTYGYGNIGFAIAGSNGGVAFPWVAPESFTLTQILFTYSVTTAPSPNTFDVGIQGFDATTGMPNGTFVSSGTWTCPASGGGFATVTVSGLSIVAGTQYYVVVRNATAGYTGSVSITCCCRSSSADKTYLPSTRTSGVWATSQLRPAGNFWLYSGTKYYGPSISTTSGSEVAVTAPNEVGVAVTFPAAGPNYILRKVSLYITTIGLGTVYRIGVRDTAGILLASSTLDGDFATGNYMGQVLDTDVTLVAGTKYYIMLQQVTGTSPLLRMCVQPSAQLMTDVRQGVVANRATFNGTTFTETLTSCPQGYLEFSGIEYTQTGGAPVYSLPASFSQIEG